MRRQGLQYGFLATAQKPILLDFVPSLRVGGATLAGGGQILAQVIEVDEIPTLRPGRTFRDVVRESWPIPEEFVSNRYSSMIHGVGLADEYPSIKFAQDFEAKGYDGVLEAGMTLCVESFIGVAGGKEGVKLEEQVLVTDAGVERISRYPFETDW